MKYRDVAPTYFLADDALDWTEWDGLDREERASARKEPWLRYKYARIRHAVFQQRLQDGLRVTRKPRRLPAASF